MGQTEIIVDLIQRQLLPQPVFALAQRADPSPDHGDMLTDGEVDPLHEGRVDVPPEWGQDVIDGLQGKRARRVVYLHPADKYNRLTRRPSQGQKVLGERALRVSLQPSAP